MLFRSSKYLNSLKYTENYSFLTEAHSKVLQQVLIDQQTAFSKFFKDLKKGEIHKPNFKSKKNRIQSCRFPIDAFGSIKGNRVNIIKKLSNIHFKCSKRDEKYLNKKQNFIKSATLTRTLSNKYELSILIEFIPKKLTETNNSIGIDLGIKDFVITSEGEVFENIKIKRNNLLKLSKLQRVHFRKVKGSKRKEKNR